MYAKIKIIKILITKLIVGVLCSSTTQVHGDIVYFDFQFMLGYWTCCHFWIWSWNFPIQYLKFKFLHTKIDCVMLFYHSLSDDVMNYSIYCSFITYVDWKCHQALSCAQNLPYLKFFSYLESCRVCPKSLPSRRVKCQPSL